MSGELITQIGVSIVAVIGLFKYLSSQAAKREKAFLDHAEKMQIKLFDYMEKKNGHLERVADKYMASSDKMSTSLGVLSTSVDGMKNQVSSLQNILERKL